MYGMLNDGQRTKINYKNQDLVNIAMHFINKSII